MFGFIPSEFEVIEGEGELKTVLLCDRRNVPNEIPENATFVAKEKGSIADFVELFMVFEESFNFTANFGVLGLGTWDLSKKEKELNNNHKTGFLDYEFVPRYSQVMVTDSLNYFCADLAKSIIPNY